MALVLSKDGHWSVKRMVGFFHVDGKGQFVEQVEAPSQAYVDRESEVCIEDPTVGIYSSEEGARRVGILI
jgi:hypothetical protein